MKKAFLFALSICLCAALLIFSGSSNRGSDASNTAETKTSQTAAPASPSPAANVIRIGVPVALTGPGSTDDARFLLGLHYAHSVDPSVDIGSTTYKIELVETDDSGTAAGAANAAKSLKKQALSAVVGPFASQNARGTLLNYTQAGLPVLALGSGEQSPAENVLTLGSPNTLTGGAAASLAQSLGKTHAAVVTDPADAGSQALGKAFEDAFAKLGGASDEFTFVAGKKNDAALAQSIQSSGADVVFMVSGAEDGEAFLRQARGAGVSCPVIGPSAWDAGFLLADAGDYSDEVYVVADYDGCGTDQVSAGFASRFSAWAKDAKDAMLKNGGSTYASSYSALGYDAYMLLVKAIKSAASADPKAIGDALKTVDYTGVTGKLAFDKAGNAARTVVCIKKLNEHSASFELLRTVEIGG